MKKLALITIAVLTGLSVSAKDDSFLSRYAAIVNKEEPEMIQVERLNQKELNEGLETGDAPLELTVDGYYSHQLKTNLKEYQVAFSEIDEKDLSDSSKEKIEKLKNQYDNLFSIENNDLAVSVWAKVKKDKVSEIIHRIEVKMSAPDFMPAGSFPAGMLESFSSDVIWHNITFRKPISLKRFLEGLGDDGDNNGVSLKKLSESVHYESTESWVCANWVDGAPDAKEWKITNKDGRAGIKDGRGEIILPLEYDSIKHCHGFLWNGSSMAMNVIGFRLYQDGKQGYADLFGKVIFPAIYDKAEHFEHRNSRYMSLFLAGKQGLGSELTGEVLVPIEYNEIIWRGDYLEMTCPGAPQTFICWDNATDRLVGNPTSSLVDKYVILSDQLDKEEGAKGRITATISNKQLTLALDDLTQQAAEGKLDKTFFNDESFEKAKALISLIDEAKLLSVIDGKRLNKQFFDYRANEYEELAAYQDGPTEIRQLTNTTNELIDELIIITDMEIEGRPFYSIIEYHFSEKRTWEELTDAISQAQSLSALLMQSAATK